MVISTRVINKGISYLTMHAMVLIHKVSHFLSAHRHVQSRSESHKPLMQFMFQFSNCEGTLKTTWD